ncbi:MAG TPA: branched-chain amino acid ABC transporter permease [Gammaproteobacteria bacterium]|nr:branched-chain amino acid ABC transporter permease [Gammaproteobacteria bacterium]
MEGLQILFTAPQYALQLLLDGLLVGALFALIGYGMALVWGVMNIINLAQGEFVILGGYVALLVFNAGFYPLWGVPVAALVLFVLGWLLYRLVIFRIVDRDLFTSLLATFGISILLQQLMDQIFGADIQNVDAELGTTVLMHGDLLLANIKLISFVLSILAGGFLVVFLRRSRIGQAIRATAQNAAAARILGVDTDRIYATTFSLNAAVCGAAGALVVMTWVIHPYIGLTYTVRSFMVVIIAGLGNLAGVALAGLGLGVAENIAGFIFGAEFQSAFLFSLLVVILLWRNWRLRRKREVLR